MLDMKYMLDLEMVAKNKVSPSISNPIRFKYPRMHIDNDAISDHCWHVIPVDTAKIWREVLNEP